MISTTPSGSYCCRILTSRSKRGRPFALRVLGRRMCPALFSRNRAASARGSTSLQSVSASVRANSAGIRAAKRSAFSAIRFRRGRMTCNRSLRDALAHSRCAERARNNNCSTDVCVAAAELISCNSHERRDFSSYLLRRNANAKIFQQQLRTDARGLENHGQPASRVRAASN